MEGQIDTDVQQTVTLNLEGESPSFLESLKKKRIRNVLLTIVVLLLVYILVKGGEAGEKLILAMMRNIV